MAVYLSPLGNEAQIDSNGDPLVGGKIYTYLAGTSTAATTYTDDSGGTPQANPIVLNANGLPDSPIWLTGGSSYKFIFKTSADATLRTVDDITGLNDPAQTTTISEWILYGSAPTYISATSFSVTGDQTGTFQVNRRVKTTNTGGTIYSLISASSYSSGTGLTTVTVVNDSGTLDSGLSAVSYGLLSATSPSVPRLSATYFQMATSRILGRTTAGTGAVEELTAAQVKAFTTPLRGWIAGLTLSTAGSSATFSVAAGEASDSTNAVLLSLAASISKTTSAWAVGTGNGGLDTGAIANSTWYHAYLIRRPDTGVVDVVFSTNASSPTLPTDYTQYRRIGSLRTNGSAQWVSFTQDGDYFRWSASVLDVNTTNPGTSAVSATLTVPTGVNVFALFNGNVNSTDANPVLHFSDLAATDEAPSGSAAPLGSALTSGGPTVALTGPLQIRSNTSAQIRYRISASTANTSVRIATLGWFDSRGRNA